MTPQTLTVSLNELGFLITRAAVGVGAPFGIAEDFAHAVKWVARFGIDPVRAAVSSLQNLDVHPEQGRIRLRENDDDLEFVGQNGLSALYAGPALADFFTLEQYRGSRLIARDVDHPLLVVAGLAAAQTSDCVVDWPGIRIYLAADGPMLEAIDEKSIVDVGPADIIVSSVESSISVDWTVGYRMKRTTLEDTAQQVIQNGVHVDAEAWATLTSLFRRCLVPSSEASRATGAGAGLVDTD